MRQDEKWYKVIVHRVETEIFDTDKGMNLLQTEIETFNKDLTLATLPH